MSKELLLRVTGPKFVAGAIFVRGPRGWIMKDCAPYLRAILRGVAVIDIGVHLKKRGFRYEWIDDGKIKG